MGLWWATDACDVP